MTEPFKNLFTVYVDSEIPEELKAFILENVTHVNSYVDDKSCTITETLNYLTLNDACNSIVRAIMHSDCTVVTNTGTKIKYVSN